jgi:hypothetical protein
MNPALIPFRELAGVVFVLVAVSHASAQVPQTEAVLPSPSIPLVSGSCPIVPANGRVALDWNPGFDHFGDVAGLRSFRFVFHPLRDGVYPNVADRLIIDLFPGGKITSTGNGFFHIEARLPRNVQPGTYQLADFHVTPDMLPVYQGEEPVATVSPVREHLCIKVVPATRQTADAQSPPG